MSSGKETIAEMDLNGDPFLRHRSQDPFRSGSLLKRVFESLQERMRRHVFFSLSLRPIT